MKLTISGIKRAAEYGISFDQFLKPMDNPDIKLFIDAVLNIGLEDTQIKDIGSKIIGTISNYIMQMMKTLSGWS